jgi:sugar O-acyltransferase (sialic acid O-acetyltransferase NeuD family)
MEIWMKKVVVVGAGGFGREVLEIFKEQNKILESWEILGFIVEKEFLCSTSINNYSVVGDLDWFEKNKDVGCVIAIGDTKARKRIANILADQGICFYNAIHPSAIISNFVNLGNDVIIGAGSFISVNTVIKNHVIINCHSNIGHDSILENYCSIMTNATISGKNHLEEGVYMGSGATLIENITIGKWSVVGAGATVVINVPDNVTAFGIPAKFMKKAP